MTYSQPLNYYTQADKKPLLFHILDVGEGLMIFLIFPDETTMLYDCNVRDDSKDEILDYLSAHIPVRRNSETREDTQWIDIFVNSHRDHDHYRGLKFVNEVFEIKSIWDSGQAGQATDDADYNYYMRLRRDLINKFGEEAIIIPAPALTPIAEYGSAQIYCLSSKEEFIKARRSLREAKAQHTNAIVLSIKYAGRSILLTSDSDWKAWKEDIVTNFGNSGLLESDILVASHHGSRSFFTDEQFNDKIDPDANPDTTYVESIDFINPSITLISCGPYKEQHHPNKDALKIYEDSTAYKQVYTTHDKWTINGLIDQFGNWTVVPSRFMPKNNSALNFIIGCQVSYDGSSYSARSGDVFPIKSTLKFSIKSQGGTIDPFNMISVIWEVSNGGIGDDHDHQEIYYKKRNEQEGMLTFKRDVEYEGKHLLRCRLKNPSKRADITKVFVVNGVKT